MDERKTFDQQITDELSDAFQQILLRHPEVRSLAGVIDYRGSLNEAPNLPRAIWRDENGAVQNPDAVFGMIFQTLQLVKLQLDRAVAIANNLQERVLLLGSELVRHHDENSTSGPRTNPADPP